MADDSITVGCTINDGSGLLACMKLRQLYITLYTRHWKYTLSWHRSVLNDKYCTHVCEYWYFRCVAQVNCDTHLRLLMHTQTCPVLYSNTILPPHRTWWEVMFSPASVCVCICVCEQLPGANSSPIVTKLGQSHSCPQGTRWLNFGRSVSKVKVGRGGMRSTDRPSSYIMNCLNAHDGKINIVAILWVMQCERFITQPWALPCKR